MGKKSKSKNIRVFGESNPALAIATALRNSSSAWYFSQLVQKQTHTYSLSWQTHPITSLRWPGNICTGSFISKSQSPHVVSALEVSSCWSEPRNWQWVMYLECWASILLGWLMRPTLSSRLLNLRAVSLKMQHWLSIPLNVMNEWMNEWTNEWMKNTQPNKINQQHVLHIGILLQLPLHSS